MIWGWRLLVSSRLQEAKQGSHTLRLVRDLGLAPTRLEPASGELGVDIDDDLEQHRKSVLRAARFE